MSSALNFGGAAIAVALSSAATHARYLDFILPRHGSVLYSPSSIEIPTLPRVVELRIVSTIRNKSSFFFTAHVDRLWRDDIAGYLLADVAVNIDGLLTFRRLRRFGFRDALGNP